MIKSDIQYWSEYFLKYTREFVETCMGVKDEDVALEKLISTLREPYQKDSSFFNTAIVKEITLFKGKYESNNKSNKENFKNGEDSRKELLSKIKTESKFFSPLPLKKGGTYVDRKNNYTITDINGYSMWIEYENGEKERLDGEINIKTLTHRNIIAEKTVAVENPIQADFDRRRREEQKLSQVKGILKMIDITRLLSKSRRSSNCYICHATVDDKCGLCFVCGWFVCKKAGCNTCGCQYGSRGRSY